MKEHQTTVQGLIWCLLNFHPVKTPFKESNVFTPVIKPVGAHVTAIEP